MKSLQSTTTWNADLYLRLSKEDRERGSGHASNAESNSIKNQRDLLLNFVNAETNQDIHVSNVLVDDGFTGANFDRVAFKDMIQHIEDGTVNCVIVKDFSRLGRDHIETGKYIERYFTSKGVRFIAVNDNYDSLHADMNDSTNSLLVPMKNILNEMFLEDISVKTRTALEIKRKNGEFVANYATYGYRKENKRLVIDEVAADVVRTIYESKLVGYSESRIAAMLNERGVPSPAEYKKLVGMAYHTPFAQRDKRSAWTPTAIKRILTNRVYIGVLEQGKYTKLSYRHTKISIKPREAWIVHTNQHDSIVSASEFAVVQELLAKDLRVSPITKQPHVFSGFVLCGYCGQPMVVKTVTKDVKVKRAKFPRAESQNTVYPNTEPQNTETKRYTYFICSTHKKNGTCRNNNISGITLEKFMLVSIQNQIAAFFSSDALIGNDGLDELQNRKKAALETLIKNAVQTMQEQNRYLVQSYTHFANGVISEDDYCMFKNIFQQRITEAEASIAHLRNEAERLASADTTSELVKQFKTHANITELDRGIVANLVQSVVAYDNQTLQINFRFANGLQGMTSQDDVSINPGEAEMPVSPYSFTASEKAVV